METSNVQHLQLTNKLLYCIHILLEVREMKLNEDKILVEPVTEKTVGGIVIPGIGNMRLHGM